MDATIGPDRSVGLTPSDRSLFLVYLILIWAAMIGGFGLDMARKLEAGTLTYPWIVHVHAVVFGGWLVLLTVQTLLIRRNHSAAHRALGPVAVILMPVMVVLGPATALEMNTINYGHPRTVFPQFAVQLANTLCFAALTGAGLLLRRSSASHKRLMVMGTLAITPPAFFRLTQPLAAMAGNAPWAFALAVFGSTMLMLLGIGFYDLATRGRLYPAYVWGLALCVLAEAIAVWLFYQPWWGLITARLIGR